MKEMAAVKFNGKWLISIALLFLHSCTQTVSGRDFCCDFNGDTLCGASQTGGYWHWSADSYPNTSGIYNFNASAPVYFVWVQSPGDVGTFDLSSSKVTFDFEDTFIIDIFQLQGSPAFDISFIPENPSYTTPVKLFDVIPSDSAWYRLQVTCSGSKSIVDNTIICCDLYPCSGVFTFTIDLSNPPNNNQLVAFSDYTINKCPDQPVAVAVDFCNKFEYDDSDWDLNGWKLSTINKPNGFHSETDYAWAQNVNGEKLTSPLINIDVLDSVFYQYYVDSSIQDVGNALNVYFNDIDSGTINLLAVYLSSQGQWIADKFTCTYVSPCCVIYPCKGNVVWESAWISGDTFIAVDDLQYNDGCANTAACCTFESANLCNYTAYGSKDGPTSGWVWSGEQMPDSPITPIDGDYIWWQTADPVSTAVYTTLQSHLVTVYPNSSITLNAYVASGSGSHSKLNINFHSVVLDQIQLLEYVVDTIDWMNLTVYCTSPSTRCCVDVRGCPGWIEFTALAYQDDPPILLAIDNVQLDSQCVM